VLLSDGTEAVVDTETRFLDLLPITVKTNQQPANMARVLEENFSRLADSFDETAGPNAHPRDMARLFGGLYFEGFVTDAVEGVIVPHELGRIPYTIVMSANLDSAEGYVHAVSRDDWSATEIQVRSTAAGNYFFIAV
jgi:hypothetical protein